MGNNDSLPPPPPPGQPPQVPPPGQYVPPAAPPSYTPPGQQWPPTQEVPGQYPPTQQMPPTQAYGQQGYPPQNYAPAEPPKKKNTGLIIGGGLVAIAAIIAGVVLLGGDDDKKTLGGDSTDVSLTVESTTEQTVVEETSTVPETLVITAPETTDEINTPTTQVQVTAAPEEGFVLVADDTGTFTVLMPDGFELDTTEQPFEDISAPTVTGAIDLAAFYADHDTFGVSVLVFDAADVDGPDGLLEAFDPGVDECPDRTTELGFSTELGAASMLRLDGCGVSGTSAKVIIAISLPERNVVVMAYGQGLGPSSGSLLVVTQFVFESFRAA